MTLVGFLVTALMAERGGLQFKFRTGQILHSIANGSPPLQHLRKCSSCVALALWRGVGYRKLVTRFGVIRRD